MNRTILNALSELAELRGTSAVVYCSSDLQPKRLSQPDVPILSQILNQSEKLPRLDFIIHSPGGLIGVARAFAIKMRESAKQLSLLVPRKAKSSATLLCLAADEIVATSSAEFGPIDPMIPSGAPDSSPLPKRISSEDIRCFMEMARTWFDLRSEENRMQVLTLLNQRFFPTTLSAFYRADRYVRRVAQELIAFQMPEVEPSRRAEIVDQLVAGFGSHRDLIGSGDLADLGLRAKNATEEEARLLRRIVDECQQLMVPTQSRGRPLLRTRAIFCSRDRAFQFVVRRNRAPDPVQEGASERTPKQPKVRAMCEWMRVPIA